MSASLARRALLLGVSLARSARALEKIARAEAGYQDTPQGGLSCVGCTFFRRPAACQVVEGSISPDGWCRLFDLPDWSLHPVRLPSADWRIASPVLFPSGGVSPHRRSHTRGLACSSCRHRLSRCLGRTGRQKPKLASISGLMYSRRRADFLSRLPYEQWPNVATESVPLPEHDLGAGRRANGVANDL